MARIISVFAVLLGFVFLTGCSEVPSFAQWQHSAVEVPASPRPRVTLEVIHANAANDSDFIASETTTSTLFIPSLSAETAEAGGIKYKGMNISAYGNWGDIETNATQVLDRLEQASVNSIVLNIPLYTTNWQSNSVFTDTLNTPSNEQIELWSDLAKERGMTVGLRPILDEQSLIPDGRWRGNIEPTNVKAWFAFYTSVLSDYVELAIQEDMVLFHVGVELNSLEQYTDEWRELIAELRALDQENQLAFTYSANWYASTVGFWESLEYISMDAFYNLDAPADATVEELVEAWQPWVQQLKSEAEAIGVPMIFAEIGCQTAEACYQEPWNWVAETPPSQRDQANYYRASCIIAQRIPLEGIFWWAVGRELPGVVNENYDPLTDREFNPLDKEAEDAMAECFAGELWE